MILMRRGGEETMWVIGENAVVEARKGKFEEQKREGRKLRESSGFPTVERLENSILRN